MKILRRFLLVPFVILIVSVGSFAQKGTNLEKTIKFARGKSSKIVKGLIADRNRTHEYKIFGREGQALTVIFDSARTDVDVCLTTPLPGTPSSDCSKRRYDLTLPIDGDYSITIDSKRGKTAYTMTVSVK